MKQHGLFSLAGWVEWSWYCHP